ncbi:MAG TPA: hypothetical protein V6D18_11890 [Thermosynechococcaceae cyanobacterium]|jgi:hypothetical protein
MKARITDEILYIYPEGLPEYKKGGSVVRNSFFWALKSIAAYAPRDRDWEFDSEVWVALQRMLLSFAESGYLGLRETQLEFAADSEIPANLRLASTWE